MTPKQARESDCGHRCPDEERRWAHVGRALEEREEASGGVGDVARLCYWKSEAGWRVAFGIGPSVTRPTLLAALEAALGLEGGAGEEAGG